MIAPTRTPARTAADAAPLICVFVLCQLLFPERLVLALLPISLTPAEVIALVAALIWLCATFTTTLGVAKGRTAVRTALFAYVVSNLVSYALAGMRYTPADEIKLADHALVLVLAHAGLSLAVCDGVRTRERLDQVLKAGSVGGALAGVIGALQFTIGYDLTYQFQRIPLLRAGSTGGVVDDRGGLARVASTTAHPIEYGVLCAMLLPLAAHYAFSARERGEPSGRWWLCAALIGSGLLFSVSRSPILGVAVVLAVLLVGWPWRRTVRILGAGLAMVAVVGVAYPTMIQTIYRLFAGFGTDPSIEYRRHRYEIAQTEFARHPVFGRGIGTWYVPKYVPFDNQWIATALEAGVVGVLAFAGIALTAAAVCARVRTAADADTVSRSLAVSLAAGLLVPLVCAFTFDLLSFHIATGLLFLYVGAAGALWRLHREGRLAGGVGAAAQDEPAEVG